MSDYYDVLGVPRDASSDEIKKAFRRKARETHPDASGDSTDDEFKVVNEAYEVLSDPEKRQMYDRFGTADPRQTGFGGFDETYGGGFGGFGDLFSVFFDMGGQQQAQRVRREGRDMAASVVVTLEEAARGAEREISYTRAAPCPTCATKGHAAGGTLRTCSACQGSGQKRTVRRTFIGQMETSAPCDECGATGQIAEPACATCHGAGRARKTERVTVTVPPGADDGGTIPIEGLGEAGLRGARAGDLRVGVRVKPHDRMVREGDDLHARASVSLTQAALGAKLTVEGLLGPTEIDVPAGAHDGQAVVARGAGMPHYGRDGQGDLYVHLSIDVPRKLSKKQRKLLEELSATLGDGTSVPLAKLRDWPRA